MAAARNTCLTWRCIDHTHEMTRGHYDSTETKMSLTCPNIHFVVWDKWLLGQFLDDIILNIYKKLG